MAIETLEKAIHINEVWRELAKGDPDFSNLWDDNNWQNLVYQLERRE